MLFGRNKSQMVDAADALAGRDHPVPRVPETHYVNGNRIQPPFPDGIVLAQFAMGCFWGAEKAFWRIDGVYSTAVGYSGGFTPNPTYEEVCSGRTGHTEAVLVAYDPTAVSFQQLLATFWEGHDPTQGMRQGNDAGTQYRSAAYAYTPEQREALEASAEMFGKRLTDAGYGAVTTEIGDAPTFFYAEDYHQQYLAKNPMGYCGLGGTGVTCPVDLGGP